MAKASFNSSFIKRARAFAKEKHKHQKRFTGEPYFTHPEAVARTVSHWTHDNEVIAAAYLHDVIEDTGCDYEDILKRFGKRVADYVSLKSRDFRLPKEKSLFLFRKQLRSAPPEVKLIEAADMEHNARTPASDEFMKGWYRKISKIIPVITAGNLGKYKKAITTIVHDIKEHEKKFNERMASLPRSRS